MLVQKQIDYWLHSSDEDSRIGGVLMEKREFLYALFFSHLALEKMLKARVAKRTRDVPPRIHNLVRSAEHAALSLTQEQEAFLREFDEYQIEGRYPQSYPPVLDAMAMEKDFQQAKELREWLKKQL